MKQEALIDLAGVGVDFPVYNAASHSLKNRLLSSVTGGAIDREHDGFVVVRGLQDITLRISPGERVGLVGHNGAGKTTMLRVLSGIYHPTHGSALIRGECVSLIDINLGIDPEATGRENIRLRSAMLGFTPDQTRRLMDDIIEFSGLGDFIDMPFRTYSTGMQLRLAFAVSTTVSPQILILDEWLSTGDENFRERAEQRMRRVVDSTDILILASHTRSLLSSNCDRVVWLEHGKIRMDDEAGKVLDAYFGPEVVVNSWHEKEAAPAEPAAPTLADRIAEAAGQSRELVFAPGEQPGGDEARIVSCRLADVKGRTLTGTVRTSEPFRLEMEFDVLQDGHHLRPGCMVCDREGAVVLWSADSDIELFRRLAKPGRHRARVDIPGRLLAPGLFQFVVALGDAKTGSRSFAAIRNILPLEVTDDPDDREVRGAFRGPLPGIVRPLLPWSTRASGRDS